MKLAALCVAAIVAHVIWLAYNAPNLTDRGWKVLIISVLCLVVFAGRTYIAWWESRPSYRPYRPSKNLKKGA